MKPNGVSIVIPTCNDEQILTTLIEKLDKAFCHSNLQYEIICADIGSNDQTKKVAEILSKAYPVSYLSNEKKQSKSTQLLKGLWRAKYQIVAVNDAPTSFSPDILIDMVQKVTAGESDILVANLQSIPDRASKVFGEIDGQVVNLRSGLKVFDKEVAERLHPHISTLSFDLEFLLQARDAGYRIGIHQVDISLPHSKHSLDSDWRIWLSSLKSKFTRSKVIPFHPVMANEKGQGFHYKGEEYVHHSGLTPDQSAIHRLSGMQMFILIALLFEVIFFFVVNWHAALVIIVALLTLLYFADLLFNLYLIYRSFSKPSEIEITDDEINSKTTWPSYTILCPLYKEWQVIPQFVTAMSQLNYPKDKLQVMLLLEEDDRQTIDEVKKINLPDFFQVVIVPDSKPKTKPKASNYGLKYATGDFVVIYDAEDIPDPMQLKKAVLAFEKSNKRIKCIQAKLNFYNPHQNLLTRVFTAEYSLWFDLVLTGLQSIHAPIPLGGTSNHFHRKDLVKLKGWDSFNVTEDCDLGMRLVKQGFQTAVINSTTLEEANSNLKNWFGQRSRWIKGYIQTYLIHMRDPRQFFKHWREPHAITFQLVVGGKVLSMFINPLMWVITLCYFLFRANIGTFIESFFPAPVLYMGVISLLLGNFLYVYYYMIGCAKHGHHELVKYGVFIPFYWLAMSIAAWIAVYKLIVAPHHWSKTKHGLHLNYQKVLNQANVSTGREIVDMRQSKIALQPSY